MNGVPVLTASGWQRKALRVQSEFDVRFIVTEAWLFWQANDIAHLCRINLIELTIEKQIGIHLL